MMPNSRFSGHTRPGTPHPALDLDVDSLRREYQQLSSAHDQLLQDLSSRESIDLAGEGGLEMELTMLREENQQLRAALEAVPSPNRAGAALEDTWDERVQEYERLLEDKSELIRNLNLQVQELKLQIHELEHGGSGSSSAGIANLERQELMRMKEEIDEARRQIEEDEQALLEQARQMELAMSKDRAELARQRNELQRFYNDLNREIEMASRDPMLRDRLANLQRRQQDVANGQLPKRPTTMQAIPHPSAAPEPPPTAEPSQKSNGLFKRFFG